MFEVVHELATLHFDVLVCDLVVFRFNIKIESWRWSVVVKQHMGQNIVVLRSASEEFQTPLIAPLVSLLVVHSSEKPSIEPHLAE